LIGKQGFHGLEERTLRRKRPRHIPQRAQKMTQSFIQRVQTQQELQHPVFDPQRRVRKCRPRHKAQKLGPAQDSFGQKRFQISVGR
jgi:hypothetical protein